MDYIPTSRYSIDRDDQRIFLEQHEADDLAHERFWTILTFVAAWFLVADGLLWVWFIPLFYGVVWHNTQEHHVVWVKKSDAEMRTEADHKVEQHPEIWNPDSDRGPIPTVYDHKPVTHTHPFFWRPDRWIGNIVIFLIILVIFSYVGRSL